MKRYLICFITLLSLHAKASHIVGGEIMYKYVSNTNGFIKYNVTLEYRGNRTKYNGKGWGQLYCNRHE